MKCPSSFLRLALAGGFVFCFHFLESCSQSPGPDSEFVSETRLHLRPRWSPNGLWIAYSSIVGSSLGIYIVDSSGTTTRLVSAIDAVGLTWSPDSRWLSFPIGGNLHKILVTGDSLTRLSSDSRDNRPAWSQNGKIIAFVRGGTELWFLDLDPGTTRRSTFIGDYPSWHPDGVEVVVMRTQFDPSTNRYVYTVSAVDNASLNARQLHTFASAATAGFSTMNPVRDELVYSSRGGENEYTQVWKVDLNTRQHLQLTTDGGDFPSWSPDGNRIVYTRTQNGDGGLWIMNSDGTGKRRLTKP